VNCHNIVFTFLYYISSVGELSSKVRCVLYLILFHRLSNMSVDVACSDGEW
jgi:hypothetical protein